MSIDRQTIFSGTEPPPAHLALDVPRLAAYLADHVTELGGDFTVEKFKGGQSNPTYRLTALGSGSPYVLRRRPPGDLVASAHDIAREYRVMSALAGTDVPVPRCYHFCSDETVIGSNFYIVSCHDGIVFWNADMPGSDPGVRAAVYEDMNARLAQLHELDYAALGLDNLAASGGYAARNLARWSKIYQQSKMVEMRDMDWLIGSLPDMLPKDERTSLLHGDYGLYNIIVGAERPKVDVVLDWEMSTLGDPYIDLAHHLRPWWEPVPTAGAASSLRGCDLPLLGIPSMDDYIASYCRHVGIAEWPDRHFYLGYAQFRYAAMIQGILARAARGTAANRIVLHTQERVFEIAALARRSIERGE